MSTTNDPRPFGWDVEVEFHASSGKPCQTFHYRGCSRATAALRGMLKRHADRVVSVAPLTEEQWVRAYGIGRM